MLRTETTSVLSNDILFAKNFVSMALAIKSLPMNHMRNLPVILQCKGKKSFDKIAVRTERISTLPNVCHWQKLWLTALTIDILPLHEVHEAFWRCCGRTLDHTKITIQLHSPGIGPGSPAWQARILPLNHQCEDNLDIWPRRPIDRRPVFLLILLSSVSLLFICTKISTNSTIPVLYTSTPVLQFWCNTACLMTHLQLISLYKEKENLGLSCTQGGGQL